MTNTWERFRERMFRDAHFHRCPHCGDDVPCREMCFIFDENDPQRASPCFCSSSCRHTQERLYEIHRRRSETLRRLRSPPKPIGLSSFAPDPSLQFAAYDPAAGVRFVGDVVISAPGTRRSWAPNKAKGRPGVQKHV